MYVTERKRVERRFVDAVLRDRVPVMLALGVAFDEETRTSLANYCVEATGQYRLRAARMLAALLPDDVLARAVEAAEAEQMAAPVEERIRKVTPTVLDFKVKKNSDQADAPRRSNHEHPNRR